MRGVLRSVPVDVELAVAMTVLAVASLADQHVPWPAYVLTGLGFAPVALRQLLPLTITFVMGAALVAGLLLGYPDSPAGGIGLLIGLFSVALLRPWPVAVVALGVALATLTTNFVVLVGDMHKWPLFGSSVLQVVAAFGLGLSTSRWSRRMERLAEQASRAVADERIRIAHELHDVVAHHMSVISLQAGVAEYVVDSDRDAAREALVIVGDTSRSALAEMRRLLAVLRVDEPDSTQPQPGLSELDGLLDRLRATGLPVTLTVTGTPRALPPGADLCAYRVAQESLTNVLKHAGPAAARLDLDYGERTLTLKITDDGRGMKPRPAGVSRGIAGMHERAELYGGVLTAGPRAGGGFAVVLRLPYREEV
ncbi:MAG TPA: sensor histidine kinase [Kutzneria sp.]|nr:sensor histidine kinase [Kutzneria sp.]